MTIYPAYSHLQFNIGHINNNNNMTGNIYPNADVLGTLNHGLLQIALLNTLEWSHI